MSDHIGLAEQNATLKQRVAQLEREITFLRKHPVFLQGLKGETLVATLTGGELTSFAATHDVVVAGTIRLEVKFSKLNTPAAKSSTRRWNWSKPLGWKDKGKQYDFLLLVGEKDLRYADQYKDDSPYVFFLIPKISVPNVCTSGTAVGANVQIITNLARARSPASAKIKSYMVLATEISSIFADLAVA